MSQIIKNLAAGPVPPTVATSYPTDSGTAIPAANVLNVFTPGTPQGTQGISTSGSGNTITISLNNHIEASTTTTGIQTANVITLPLGSTAGNYTIDSRVSGFCSAIGGGPLGAGYTIVGAVRTDGATAILLPNQAVDTFEEGALSAGNCALAVSGNNLLITVTGTVFTTIDWKATLDYVFTS